MINDLRMLVVEALNDEDEIRLFVGENEFYVDRPDFSITVEYNLESFEDFYSFDDDRSIASKYVFHLLNVFYSNLSDDIEYDIPLDDELLDTIVDVSYIDNWSGSLICLRNALYDAKY